MFASPKSTVRTGVGMLLLLCVVFVGSADARECVYVANRGYDYPPVSDHISVIDAASRRVVASLGTDGTPVGMATDSTAKLLYVVTSEVTDDRTYGRLSVIDPSTGRSLRRFPLAEGAGALVLSPDDRVAYVAIRNKAVAFVDLASGTLLARVPTGGTMSGDPFGDPVFPPLALSPDGALLFFPQPTLEEATLGVIDTASATRTATLTLMPELDFPEAVGMAISPDGRFGYVLVTHGNGVVPVLDLETLTAVGTLQFGCSPAALRFSTGGDRLFAVTCGDWRSVNLATGAIERYDLDLPGGRANFAVSGTAAYVAHYEHDAVSIVDLATGRLEATIAVGPRPRDVVVIEEEGEICAPGGQAPRPTSTPVPTPRPTATPVVGPECPVDVPCVQVRASASGVGDSRTVELYLQTAGRAIVGVQTDLTFDARAISIEDCRSGSGLSSLGFTPVREGVLRGILLTPSQENIPDGTMLQACTATVRLDASPGVTSLRVTNLVGAGPQGARVELTGTAADLPILASTTAPVTSDAANGRAATAGCHVSPESPASPSWLAVIALLIPASLRRLKAMLNAPPRGRQNGPSPTPTGS